MGLMFRFSVLVGTGVGDCENNERFTQCFQCVCECCHFELPRDCTHIAAFGWRFFKSEILECACGNLGKPPVNPFYAARFLTAAFWCSAATNF
jgi:hypothetical protein